MRRNSGAIGSSMRLRWPGTSGPHSGDPAARRSGPKDRVMAMRTGRARPHIHTTSAVIHGPDRHVDEMGTVFVGNPLLVAGPTAQHRLGAAPATTAANLAKQTAGGRGE